MRSLSFIIKKERNWLDNSKTLRKLRLSCMKKMLRCILNSFLSICFIVAWATPLGKLNMLEMSNLSACAHILGEGAHTGNFSPSSLKENSFGIVSPAGFCLRGQGYMNE